MTESQNRKFPWAFVVLAFGFNWLLLLPALLGSFGWIDLPLPVYALVAVAQFGPSVAAFWLAFHKEGRVGVKRLFFRAFDFHIPLKWLAALLVIPNALSGLAMLLHFVLDGKLPAMPLLAQPLAILPTFLMIFFFYGAFPEEFGWRGYLLDRLQARWTALAASLVLGALWGLWHLPAFFINGVSQAYMPLVPYLIWACAVSIIVTWIYNNTNGNLLAAMLFHASINFSIQLFPVFEPVAGGDQRAFIYLALLTILFSLIVIVIWAPGYLSWHRTQNKERIARVVSS